MLFVTWKCSGFSLRKDQQWRRQANRGPLYLAYHARLKSDIKPLCCPEEQGLNIYVSKSQRGIAAVIDRGQKKKIRKLFCFIYASEHERNSVLLMFFFFRRYTSEANQNWRTHLPFRPLDLQLTVEILSWHNPSFGKQLWSGIARQTSTPAFYQNLNRTSSDDNGSSFTLYLTRTISPLLNNGLKIRDKLRPSLFTCFILPQFWPAFNSQKEAATVSYVAGIYNATYA